ncbi:type VI secretion system tube protein Hcp [Caballeronia sp. LZ065]|uniref:Hcp family type VI secretion system effector n=1 Tax=Caballeronia sp. LZ065 TaxID=3038571 RepID=UPI002859E5BB|nr:type VI secretion system tube protein Hcp [Caballeronia sp. LZ065]MDR5783383.1 type VI secretion system tube protein Hcp [Caballeronia sp. LZ065]
MADIFLKIDSIRGESQEHGHVNEIEVMSWTWRICSDSHNLSSVGNGMGKATVQDMEIVHHIDCASPNLMRNALNGAPIPKAMLTMRKPSGVPLDFQEFTLVDVRITGGNPVGASGAYIETVKLSFSKVKQEYMLQKPTGGNGGAIVAAFDLSENRET